MKIVSVAQDNDTKLPAAAEDLLPSKAPVISNIHVTIGLANLCLPEKT